MSGERFVVFLFSIIVIIAFIYYIYKEIKEHQEEEQIRIYEEKRKKEFETLLATKRKEDSIKWNQKIQRQFKGKVNHKPNKPIKILVGDYHNWMAPLTNGILREMGISTEVVPTASDIIDRIKNGNEYNFIITNNTYPNGESGSNVLSLKEDSNFNIPIIVLTVEQDKRRQFINLGFDEYIEKPIDYKKVINTLCKFDKDIKFSEIKKQ